MKQFRGDASIGAGREKRGFEFDVLQIAQDFLFFDVAKIVQLAVGISTRLEQGR